MNPQIDFLSIGDIATDAFIRIKDANIHCNVKRDECEICLKFKEKIPYEFVEVVKAVGNSANAAVSASRLGLKTALVSNLGDDENGNECVETLKREGVDASFIKKHSGAKTNYHFVLWYEDDRTILVKHEKYDYKLPDLPSPKWVYLSSIGSGTEEYHKEIGEYLAKNPESKVAFQPGTFQIKMGRENLAGIYKRANIFFCNFGEAEKILDRRGEIKDLLIGIKELGPEIVVITNGHEGSYLLWEGSFYHMPVYPDKNPPLERTGAGDAFSSTFVSALALGKDPLEAITWGPANAMSVVNYIGAQKGLLKRDELMEWLNKAPDNYKPEKIG